jgi:hypothetical protein
MKRDDGIIKGEARDDDPPTPSAPRNEEVLWEGLQALALIPLLAAFFLALMVGAAFLIWM